MAYSILIPLLIIVLLIYLYRHRKPGAGHFNAHNYIYYIQFVYCFRLSIAHFS
jgi:hypothetical protein